MSDSREKLIQTREKELDQLQIVLSLKRRRELEIKEEELLSTEPTSTSTLTKKTKTTKSKNIMKAAYLTVSLHFDNYLKLPFRTKMFFFLTANSIINLTWNYKKLADVSQKAWEEYYSKNITQAPNLPNIPGSVTILQHLQQKESETAKDKYLAFCTQLIPLAKNDDDLKTFRIYGQLISIFAFRQKDIDRWRRMSEADIFKAIWSPILDIIFEGSSVILASGETENSGSKELDDLHNSNERGAFKVDLRAILESTSSTNPALIKAYDVANCEVAKDGKVSKTTIDNAKLLVEAKVILDQIIAISRLEFGAAKKISVVNLQISGLKAQLVQVKHAHDQSGYVSQILGKLILFPTSPEHIVNFVNIGLPLLFYWKEIAEKNLRIIQNGLNTDDSAFGDQSLRTSLSFTKPTWLGPKTQQAKTIPPLPNLSF